MRRIQAGRMPELFLFAGLSVAFAPGCRDASPSTRAAVSTAGATATVERPHRLGGGYQGISWGTGRAEALTRLGGQQPEGTTENADQAHRQMPDGRRVDLFFFQDRLWKVVVHPFHERDNTPQAGPTTRMMMEQRYGAGTTAAPIYADYEREMIGMGLRYVEREALAWNDRETSIQLEYPIVNPAGHDTPAASMISITYVGDAILDERSAYLTRAEAAARASSEAAAQRAAAEQSQRLQQTLGGAL